MKPEASSRPRRRRRGSHSQCDGHTCTRAGGSEDPALAKCWLAARSLRDSAAGPKGPGPGPAAVTAAVTGGPAHVESRRPRRGPSNALRQLRCVQSALVDDDALVSVSASESHPRTHEARRAAAAVQLLVVRRGLREGLVQVEAAWTVRPGPFLYGRPRPSSARLRRGASSSRSPGRLIYAVNPSD